MCIRDSVQSVTPVMRNNEATVTATLPTAVDTSRTLLLASTQAHNGQSSGETSHKNSARPGVVTARFLLNSPTQVEARREISEDATQWTVYAIQLDP